MVLVNFFLLSLKVGDCAECELVTMSVMALWNPTDGKQANEALFFQIYSKTSYSDIKCSSHYNFLISPLKCCSNRKFHLIMFRFSSSKEQLQSSTHFMVLSIFRFLSISLQSLLNICFWQLLEKCM